MDMELQKEMRNISFGNACTLVMEIPVYFLSATLTGRFWEEIDPEIYLYVQ